MMMLESIDERKRRIRLCGGINNIITFISRSGSILNNKLNLVDKD
jgi:hypothetical protein